MDPLSPVENFPLVKVGPKPPTSTEPTTDLDNLFYALGGGGVLASQLFSKSAPHTAKLISENVAGPELAIGKGQLSWKLNNFLLSSFAPAPVGYVPPEVYGLPPNYVYGWNKFATYNAPYLPLPKLPPSEILHNLPDSDPRVQAANWQQRGVDQRNLLEQYTGGAPLGDLLDLYRLSLSSQRGRFFYSPEDIQNSLEVAIRVKAGLAAGDKLIVEARNDVTRAEKLPKSGPEFTALLSPFDTPSAPGTTAGVTNLGYEALLRLIDDQVYGSGGLYDKPTDARQEGAWRRAPQLMKEIISERADP